MNMHSPPHPGQTLQHLYLNPLKLTVSDVANHLGVTEETLSQILNGDARITPEMAIRLSKAFVTSPDTWLNKQIQYDLWQASIETDFTDVQPIINDWNI